MTITITKNVSREDLEDVFEGVIPDCHPSEYIDSRLRDKNVFVAKNENENAGFLIYSIWWGNCPFIELIKVKKNYQRNGIGKKLLENAKEEIRSKNFKTLISSSEVVNDMGQYFHEKCEFQELAVLDLPHGKEQFFSIDLEEAQQ